MRVVGLGVGLALLAGCAAPPPAPCAGVGGEPGITATLFFGRSGKAGPIGDQDWQDFLARSITTRFPDGLTVLDGRGQWRQRATGKVVSQPATIVVIATDAGAETLARLEGIRAAYRTRFEQESVGLVTSASCAAF